MTRGGITMPRAVRRALAAEARAAAPRECCGFLLGAGRHVRHAVPMPNVAPGRTRFRIRDADHVTLRRMLRGAAPPLGIVGVYHSHPAGAARPSPTDIAESHYPDWVHVIVGLVPRLDVRAFRIQKGRGREVPCVLVSSSV